MTASPPIVRQTALDDVRGIFNFVAADSLRSAEKFRVEFKQAVERIRAFPQMGHRTGLATGDVRVMRVSSRFRHYMIIYRVGADVEVVRVLHSAMDIAAQLLELDRE